METKKLAATFAILMIVLGVAGFAYAHWSETLWLQGTVNTGKLCLEWSFNAELPPSNLKDLDNDGQVDDPVAILTVEFVDEDDDGCNEGLNITLDNAYPSLTVEGTIDIHNCGTIPAKILVDQCVVRIDPEGAEDWVEVKLADGYVKNPQGNIVYEDLEWWLQNVNQLDPCWTIAFDFKIHFLQEMPENSTATIYVEIVFANWNAP